jgi:hypothetical protein
MIRIDEDLLIGVGLRRLPKWEKNLLLKHLYETLETRVGIRLADRMSTQQLDEFEAFFDAKDDKGAFAWLEHNFPDYKDIVDVEFTCLKDELTQAVPTILSYSRRGELARDTAAATGDDVAADGEDESLLAAAGPRSDATQRRRQRG